MFRIFTSQKKRQLEILAMTDSAALDVAWRDLESLAPAQLSDFTDFTGRVCLDEIEPPRSLVLSQFPSEPPPFYHHVSEQDAMRVLLDMIGIAPPDGSTPKTLSPEIFSSFQNTKSFISQGEVRIEWDDVRLIRNMTPEEQSVDILALFQKGTAVRQFLASDFPSSRESRLERLLRRCSQSLVDGRICFDGTEWSPTQLLNVLLSPSEDLKKKMKFTSRSKGPQPIKHFGDVVFLRAVMSPFCKVYPQAVQLLPTALWKDIECIRFGELVAVHFQRRNNDSSRFMLKMHNALRLTDDNPDLFCVVGLKWVNDVVIGLNKRIFAQLVGISPASVDGALLNAQGNFSTHGFVEISRSDHLEKLGVPTEEVAMQRGSDGEYRFLVHAQGAVRRSRDVEKIENKGVRWQKDQFSFRDACETFGLEY